MRPKLSLAAFLLLAATSFLVGCNSDQPTPVASCSDQPGTICTWAGTGHAEYSGNGGPPEQAGLYWPIDVTFASDGRAYIADWNNHAIRQVGLDGKVHTVVGTGFDIGDGPVSSSTPSDLIPPGPLGTKIALNHPTDVKELPNGKILVVCWHNHKLREYDPATGLVVVTCGRGAGFRGDGGPADSALLAWPTKAAVAASGDVYLLDQENQRVRKIDASGRITTVVGTGIAGFSGDGGSPLSAQLHFPSGGALTGNNPAPGGGLALDSQGMLYISDTMNRRIRRVDFAANVITTIAGTDSGYGGDGGPAVDAKLAYPFDIDFGPDGRLYVADKGNDRIRAIDLTTGIINTVAGNGRPGFSGDGGNAVDASLHGPLGIAFDNAGHLYIADTYNSRIRRVTL